MPALLVIVAMGGVMVFVGWRRLRRHGRSADGLAGLTLVATVLAAAVVGTFDAVLLLAVPSLFIWGLIGALLPPQRELAAIALPEGRRRLLALAVAAAALLFALRSTAQAVAMLVAGSGRSVRVPTRGSAPSSRRRV